MDNIEEKLEQLKVDVMRTECPIVIAGETSSGKSSIINLILGEKILPTSIGASTSRVCRVKYSECYELSTKDRKGKIFGEKMSFENSKQMAQKLQDIARTADEEISYVDIYMPVPVLQGNIIIVEAPGFGDHEQKGVADKMMSYLPNALAFIYVVNVPNAGGIQDDRIFPVLSKLKNSMAGMVSFSPEDVIFLLNKWDTITHVDEDNLEIFFEKTKENLRNVWNDVDESRIFRISARKVTENKPKYTRTFDMFQRALKEVIARNENKRVKVHLRAAMELRSTAQDVHRCKFCETIVHSYCDFCHVNLCKPCIGEHISDGYDKHKIVLFKDRRSTLIYPKCKKHAQKNCKFQCKECNISVCSSCMASEQHRGHIFIEILEVYEKRKGLVENHIRKLEETISPEYEEKALYYETQLANLDGIYEKLTAEITRHGEQWHREIDIIINKMKTKTSEIKEKHRDKLQIRLDEIKQQQDLMKKALLVLRDITKSNEMSQTIEYIPTIGRFSRSLPKVKITSPTFKSAPIDREQLHTLFGHITPLSILEPLFYSLLSHIKYFDQ